MKPPRFQYACPMTLSEALTLLSQHNGNAVVLAGGQSLMPMLNLRVAQPAILIDINRVPELDAITCAGSVLSIGAQARHNDVLRSPMVKKNAPLLAQALEHVAHEAIRNRGTLGGSLALADPAAEIPACAICLDATIVAVSLRGERYISAGDFFRGLYTTALEPDEIIARVSFPLPTPDWRFRFDEVSRRHGDFAIAGVAVGMRCEGKTVTDCRIVFCAIEGSPRRMAAIENLFTGTELVDEAVITRAKAALGEILEPLDGGEFPPAYRLHVASELLARVARNIISGAASAGDDK
jgi:aerobic carbon-monoxide dehydrogenase medium subunit